MGLAASQARYLALAARKSNIEYEGQQINQSRLALSNQSANLFNQMLGMSVPTAPDTSQYTRLQYTWSDGTNDSTIEKYTQISDADSDYNYIVTSSHNENVYTGARKKLSNPQVQATKTDHYYYDSSSITSNSTVTSSVSKAWTNTDGTYGIETTDGTTTIYKPVTTAQEAEVRAINAGNGVKVTGTASWATADDKAKYSLVNTTDTSNINNVIKLYGLTGAAATAVTNGSTKYYTDGNGNYIDSTDYGTTLAAGTTVATTSGKGLVASPGPQDYYTDGTKFVTKTDLDSAVTTYNSNLTNKTSLKNTVNVITPDDVPTFSNYTGIGNSSVTELTAADLSDSDTKAEIDQIMKDMGSSKNGDTISAENLAACFTSDTNGNPVYTGGLYKFTMNGTTYYTTQNDLATAASTAASDGDSKLSYYTASYISTKVEDTHKALLETDSSGRFSTAKFEDDSTVYDLSVATITDTDAYNDAMNEYNYDQKQYDKTVSDINAKTEIIQAQDRTLELRLEQLNTEQSALQTEMDAVKKVVDKHIETGFKTFGG